MVVLTDEVRHVLKYPRLLNIVLFIINSPRRVLMVPAMPISTEPHGGSVLHRCKAQQLLGSSSGPKLDQPRPRRRHFLEETTVVFVALVLHLPSSASFDHRVVGRSASHYVDA